MTTDVRLIDFEIGDFLTLRLDGVVSFDSDVKVILTLNRHEYVLLNDILGYAIKELKFHFENDQLELIPEFQSVDIGFAQNEYYYHCANDLPLNKPEIIEANDIWIGSKYNCFESQGLSTWVYLKKGKRYLKVTPLFSFYCDTGEHIYEEFLTSYKVIYEKQLKPDDMLQCTTAIRALEQQLR